MVTLDQPHTREANIVNTELLNDVRAYRNWLSSAFEAMNQVEKQRAWNTAHEVARELLRKYGPATFERIDTMAYYYS